MSKYIKLEDAEKLLTNALRIAQGFDEPLERSLVDLPTIEVSDEQLSKLQSSENSVENTTASEDFTSISRANSKLEVSEDAISREYLKSFEYINKGDFNSIETIREWIDNAPSVVPQAKEGEWIPCNERLPEKEGMYLVSAKKHSWDSDFDDVVIAYHSPNHTWFNVSSCDILAWMPLPKPYKGADDDN